MLTIGAGQLLEYIVVETDRRPGSVGRDVVMYVDRADRGMYYSLIPI